MIKPIVSSIVNPIISSIIGLIDEAAPLNIADVFSIDLGTGARTVTNGLDFSGGDGLVWSKSRANVESHQLYDTIRGVTKKINSDFSGLESTDSQGLTAFNNNGFTLGTSITGSAVSWSFLKAAKFLDIITYSGNSTSGREISHSLGVVPGLVAVKDLSDAANWAIQHISRGGTKVLHFDDDFAEFTQSDKWNNTTADASNVTLGTNTNVNITGDNYVMYVFAHDPASDGVIQCAEFDATGGNVFVDLSMDIQYLMIKPYDAVGDWEIFDNTRGVTKELNPNLTAAETTVSRVTFDTGGFTFIPNESTNYIFMAIKAE